MLVAAALCCVAGALDLLLHRWPRMHPYSASYDSPSQRVIAGLRMLTIKHFDILVIMSTVFRPAVTVTSPPFIPPCARRYAGGTVIIIHSTIFNVNSMPTPPPPPTPSRERSSATAVAPAGLPLFPKASRFKTLVVGLSGPFFHGGVSTLCIAERAT